MSEELVLQEDLIVPAGTRFQPAARKTERYGEHYQASITLTPDNAATLTVYAGDPMGGLFEYAEEEE